MAAEKKATRAAYGETLVELVEQGIDVVAVEADLSGSTTTKKLGAAHPERLVNVGIAEQDMVGVAAGLSLTATPHSLARSPCSALAVCMIKFATPCAMRI